MTDERRESARYVKRRVQQVLLKRTMLHLAYGVLTQLFANEAQTYALRHDLTWLLLSTLALFFVAGAQYGNALLNAYQGYKAHNMPLEEFQ